MPENLAVEAEEASAEATAEQAEAGQPESEKESQTPDDPNAETANTSLENSEDDGGEEQEQEQEEEEDDRSLFTKTQEKYLENGELGDDDYAALKEKYGVDKSEVDEYIGAREAAAEAVTEAGKAIVGGNDEYEAMTEWAKQNLSDDDKAKFNEEVQSGQTKRALDAVRGLHEQYRKSKGSDPKMVKGTRKKAPGAKPFASQDEVVQAMSDPRYKTDPSYRAKVEKRLAASG